MLILVIIVHPLIKKFFIGKTAKCMILFIENIVVTTKNIIGLFYRIMLRKLVKFD